MSRAWTWFMLGWMGLLSQAVEIRAADPEEAQYNVVVNLYNAGQWQAAVAKIEEREKLTLPDAMRARYLYAKGLAYEKGQKSAEARAAYDTLVQKFPTVPQAQPARLAMLYLDYAAGRTDAVIATYPGLNLSALPAADKRNASLMYAESLYAKSPDKAALDAYRQALAHGAEAASVAPKLLDLHLRLGQHAEVLTVSAAGVAGVAPDRLAMIRADACLALQRYPEAQAEAKKIPAESEFYGRAALVQAQALMRQGKLQEAAGPLEEGLAKLRGAAASPAAYVVLAECLLEAGRQPDADKALQQAENAIRQAPQEERAKLQGQVALLRVRTAMLAKDRRRIIEAVAAARSIVTSEQLPRLLYLRLAAWHEDGNANAIVAAMSEDLPVFRNSTEFGAAALIFAGALNKSGQRDQAAKLLEEFIQAKPDAPEALQARVELAYLVIGQDNGAKARPLLEAAAKTPGAAEKLGKAAFDELQFNRAVLAQRADDHAGAAAAFKALLDAKPSEPLTRQVLPLLGQSYAMQKNYAAAAATWKQALNGAPPAEEADLRDRLARVLLAAGDQAGAIEQFQWAAKAAGGEAKLSAESREMLARALYQAKRYAEAAGVFQSLADTQRDHPDYAFEAAAAFERAGQLADAERNYQRAAQGKDKLTAEYAAVVDSRLAHARLSGNLGDQGLSIFLSQVEAARDEVAFESAVGALRRIAAAGQVNDQARTRLNTLLDKLPPQQARRYAVGSVVLLSLLRDSRAEGLGFLANQLALELGEHEQTLDVKSSGATLGAAIIYYAKGEAERRARRYADALAAYETVLAAYPYNEWPLAASCGAAECLAALGDRPGAIARFKEIVATAGQDAAAAPWRDLAQRRIAELEQGT